MTNIPLKDYKILIVDQHEEMHRILSTMLRALEVTQIETVKCGEEALEKLSEFDADIIITNQVMEPLGGIQLTKMIRSGSRGINPFVPVIMVSGHAEKKNIIAARDAGVHEFLAKPVSAKAFYARLRRIVEHPRSFVRSPDYYGPDRRRRAMPFDGQDRRQYKYDYTP